MWGGWPESVVATGVAGVESAVVVGTSTVVEVVDVDVVAGSVEVVAATAVGATMRGASVACEDAAPSPPHAANDRSAATSHAHRLAAREERKLSPAAVLR